MPRLFLGIALAGTGPAGCALLPDLGGSGAPETASAVWRDDIRLRVDGILAEPDAPPGAAPCPVILAEDGRIFALVGALGSYRLGDRLEIVGPPAIWSTCQTYQVLRADEVKLLERRAPGS